MAKIRRSLLVAVLVFGAVAAGAFAVIRRDVRAHHEEQRRAAARLAVGAAFSLEQQLSRSLSATYAVAALLRHDPDLTDFQVLAGELVGLYRGLDSLQLAPGGVVREVHPKQADHPALGHDLLSDPARAPEARAAIEKRQLVLAGPFELRQGGQGVVGRLPVFIPDGAGGERFWGFAIAVIRLPDLLEVTNLSRLAGAGLLYELSRHTPEGVVEVFASSASAPLVDAVSVPVEVPNATWSVAVAPAGGWRPFHLLAFEYALGLFVSFAAACVAYLVVRQPELLQQQVRSRTAELARANADLEADIAKRKQVEEALRITQFAVDRASQGIAWLEPDGAIRDLNDSACALLGRGRDQLLRTQVDALYGGPGASWRERSEQLAREGTLSLETRVQRPGAAARDLEVTLNRLDVAGQPLTVAYFRDVTGHRRAEEQLRQAQKLEAIGQLAGGVAHDFNNLLTSILGYACVLARKAAPGTVEAEAVQTIRQAGERAAELTKQLLGFARRGKFLDTAVDVHAIVAEVTALLGRTIDKAIRIERRLCPGRPAVKGDPEQIHLAVLNLAVNARDAMPAGGAMVFETAIVEIDAGAARALGGVAPGRYLELSVRDDGEGIPKEIQHRIFEPFFTTKEPGKGTGLGLATVYGVARNHAGALSFDSVEGRGSRFTLHLPLLAETEVVEHGRPSSPARPGAGKILVVDDEPMVRGAASRMLVELGYEVVAVGSGEEAVRYYAAHPDEVDLVLLDMIMPGMGGSDCFRRIKEVNPRVRAILSSGYGREGKAQEILDEGILDFLQKPYSLSELSEAVGLALG